MQYQEQLQQQSIVFAHSPRPPFQDSPAHGTSYLHDSKTLAIFIILTLVTNQENERTQRKTCSDTAKSISHLLKAYCVAASEQIAQANQQQI